MEDSMYALMSGKDMIAVTLNKAKVSANSGTIDDARSDGGSAAKVVRVSHSQPLSDAKPETASHKQISEESTSHPLHTPEVADVLVAYSTAPGKTQEMHVGKYLAPFKYI